MRPRLHAQGRKEEAHRRRALDRERVRRISVGDALRSPEGAHGGWTVSTSLPSADRRVVQTDRWTWMALAAAKMAFDDAKFNPPDYDPYSMSVITASSSGGNDFGQKEIQNLWGKGPIYVGAYQSIAWFYAATTGQIGIAHGMKGASGVVLAEGAGGLEAMAQARRAIRRGVETVVTGGLEAPLGPYALTCQLRNNRLSHESEPAEAYRPFDARANGYVPGEGGAIILAESLDRAR